MEKWRYVPFGIYSGPENMAIDEMLLNQVVNAQGLNTIRFYQWNPTTATIGAHQSLSAEVDIEFAQKHHVDVVRRITGGGAVLHDNINEITYSIICRMNDLPKITSKKRTYSKTIPQRYQPILEALAQGLEYSGINIVVDKIHCPALLIQGKKISGNAQIIRKNVLLQHGTILLDVDPEFMYKVLKAPKGVDYTKMVQSVRTKVTGLRSILNQDIKNINKKEIVSHLKHGFEEVFKVSLESVKITPTEWQEVQKLTRERYENQAWLNKYP